MGKMISAQDKANIEEAGSKLTAKQRALVDNLFIPGTTQEEAAIQAGYAANSAHVTASRTLRLEHVMDYLDVCITHGNKLQAIKAQQVIESLLDTAKSDYVKLQAAQDVMDRAGHKSLEKQGISVMGDLNVQINLGD